MKLETFLKGYVCVIFSIILAFIVVEVFTDFPNRMNPPCSVISEEEFPMAGMDESSYRFIWVTADGHHYETVVDGVEKRDAMRRALGIE